MFTTSRIKLLKTRIVIIFILCISILLGITIFNIYPNIDINLANIFFNTNSLFFLKDNWWLAVFFHFYFKIFIIALILIFFIIHIYNKQNKQSLILSFSTVILIPIIISLIKKFSVHACPWDLSMYGGSLPLVKWWDKTLILGKCFPAGHAGLGLCIMGISVFYFIQNNKKFKFFYFSGIFLGLTLGIMQQIRGAHFLSHTLASIAIASIISECMCLIKILVSIPPHRT